LTPPASKLGFVVAVSGRK